MTRAADPRRRCSSLQEQQQQQAQPHRYKALVLLQHERGVYMTPMQMHACTHRPSPNTAHPLHCNRWKLDRSLLSSPTNLAVKFAPQPKHGPFTSIFGLACACVLPIACCFVLVYGHRFLCFLLLRRWICIIIVSAPLMT